MMPQMDQLVEIPYDPLEQAEQPQQPKGGSSFGPLGWLSILALASGGAFMARKKGSKQVSALTGGLRNEMQSRSPPVTMSLTSPGDLLLRGFGDDLFKGAVADLYLTKYGLKAGSIEKGEWVKSPEDADKVAAAGLEWA